MNNGKCERCGGSGLLPEFMHIRDGVCFVCAGTGRFFARPEAKKAKANGWPVVTAALVARYPDVSPAAIFSAFEDEFGFLPKHTPGEWQTAIAARF